MTRDTSNGQSGPASLFEAIAYKLPHCHPDGGVVMNVMFTCAHDGLLLDYNAFTDGFRDSLVVLAYAGRQPDIDRDAGHALDGQRRCQPRGPLTAQDFVDHCPMEAQKTGSFALIELTASQPFSEPLASVHHAPTVGVVPAVVKPEFAVQGMPTANPPCETLIRPMKNALWVLRENIAALLSAQRKTQHDLAFSLGRGRSWINKFLQGTREIQMKDLDGIAAFFHIQTYQLFQPGISQMTERRSGSDRRQGFERRTPENQQAMVKMASQLAALPKTVQRGVNHAQPASSSVDNGYQKRLNGLTQKFAQELVTLVSPPVPRRQATGTGDQTAQRNGGTRTRRRSDPGRTPKTR